MGHLEKMPVLETFKFEKTGVVFNRLTSIDCRLSVSFSYFCKEKMAVRVVSVEFIQMYTLVFTNVMKN